MFLDASLRGVIGILGSTADIRTCPKLLDDQWRVIVVKSTGTEVLLVMCKGSRILSQLEPTAVAFNRIIDVRLDMSSVDFCKLIPEMLSATWFGTDKVSSLWVVVDVSLMDRRCVLDDAENVDMIRDCFATAKSQTTCMAFKVPVDMLLLMPGELVVGGVRTSIVGTSGIATRSRRAEHIRCQCTSCMSLQVVLQIPQICQRILRSRVEAASVRT